MLHPLPAAVPFARPVASTAAAVLLLAATAASTLAVAVITTTSLPDGNVGTEYAAFIEGSGEGEGPLVFRVVEGKLPSGLKLERSFGSQSALIFGTPTREGTSTFTVQVRDGLGDTATQTLSITIGAPRALLITNPSPTLRAGTVGEAYAANLFADGGVPPYRWEVIDGALPDGLDLKGNQISGVPELAGSFTFTAQVTDKAGATAQQAFTIVVS